MSVVHMISTKDELLTLDSTISVSKSRRNSLTKSSIMSGAQISDGYTVGNPSITFSGICSYSKISRTAPEGDPPTPDQFNVILDEMVLSQERFTLYSSSTKENLIPTLDDVVIIDYNIEQGQWQNAINVTITVEQVFISSSAQKARITNPAKITNGDITEKEDLGQGNKTQIDEDSTILRNFFTEL